MLNGERQSVKAMLVTNRYSLVNNQREYVWSVGKGQITDLLDDISYYSKNIQEDWFLGQIILLKDDSNGSEEYRIIDGQQRLTTLCLFLAVCRDKAMDLNNTQQAAQMQHYISSVHGVTGTPEGLRVSPSKSIKDIFEKICLTQYFNFEKPEGISAKGWRHQLKIIKNIFEEFKSFLANMDQASLDNTIAAVLRAYFFRLISTEAAETYSLFENTNAKGTPLEATDLLKNLLMDEMDGAYTLESDWNDIANNSGTTGVRMLKYYYTSKKGTLERGNIYRRVRDDLVRPDPNKFINDYKVFSFFFKTFNEDITIESLRMLLNEYLECESIVEDEPATTRIFHSIQGLQELNITLYIPLVFSIMQAYIRNNITGGTINAIARIFEAFENFHFVNTYICDSRANRVEKLYAPYCKRFNDCKDGFIDLINSLILEMKNKYTVKEESFIPKFTEILEYNEMRKGNNSILFYVFDRFNNYDEKRGKYVDTRQPFYSPAKNIKKHLYSIEHLSPRNPKTGQAVDSLNNIGNLFVIGSSLNKSLGNLSPKEKILKLKNERYQDVGNNKMLKEFVDGFDGNWSEEKITARAVNLAKRAYTKIWKFQ